MNREDRKQQLKKIAEQAELTKIAQQIEESMEADDTNNAGENPEQYAERFTMEALKAIPIPGLSED